MADDIQYVNSEPAPTVVQTPVVSAVDSTQSINAVVQEPNVPGVQPEVGYLIAANLRPKIIDVPSVGSTPVNIVIEE